MGAVNRHNMVEPLDFDAGVFLICPSLNYRDRRDYHALSKNNNPELRKALSRANSKAAGDVVSMTGKEQQRKIARRHR